MNIREDSNRDKFINSLCLPRDICFGDIRIVLTGCHEALVENYKGIIEYDDSFILLQGKRNKVLIEGGAFRIDYYTNTDMKISGIISAVKYL